MFVIALTHSAFQPFYPHFCFVCPILRSYSFTSPKKIFVDGNDVCLLYDMVTNTPVGTAFIAEWYHVKDNKIGSLRIVFDARPFAALLGR
jgi:hypothetical protein